MTPPPKHLWSGDWRGDSDATADELAALRDRPRPVLAEEEPPPRAAAHAPPPPRPPRARRQRRAPSQRVRLAIVLVLAALITAGIGIGLTSALGTDKSASNNQTAYLGLHIASHALMGGLIIRSVDPGSPAARAGIKGGDVLARIGQVEVHSPGDVRALLLGRRPGDDVQLGIERGQISFTVDVRLAPQP